MNSRSIEQLMKMIEAKGFVVHIETSKKRVYDEMERAEAEWKWKKK